MSDDLEVVRGQENVFADAGDPDAETKHMKAQIASEIIATLNRNGMSVRAAARAARCDPADIQRIRNAALSRFTLDRLMRIAFRLGQRFEILPRPHRSAASVA